MTELDRLTVEEWFGPAPEGVTEEIDEALAGLAASAAVLVARVRLKEGAGYIRANHPFLASIMDELDGVEEITRPDR